MLKKIRKIGVLKAGSIWLVVGKGCGDGCRTWLRLIISWDFRGNEYQNTEKIKRGLS